jgi:hypothetical protein
MSFLFNGANDAAQSQQNAAIMGMLTTQANEGNAINALQSTTNQALPYYQTNWGTSQQGVGALSNLLGLNGAAGTQSALANLQTTPGYQFTLGQGNNAINAAAAANGTLNSGNQLTALANYDSGLAQNTYNQAVSNLNPFLNLSNSTASGIGNLLSNLGSNEANTYMGANNTAVNLLGSYGNAQASADLANQSLGMNLLGGGLKLGSSLFGALNTPIAAGSVLGSIFSDERLKEDIEPVGELYDGSAIFRYRYKGDPTETTHIGVMAQDVAETNPDAVTDIGGFLAVNYRKATEHASELGKLLEAA